MQHSGELIQMTCDTPIKYKDLEFESLTSNDVPQMMKLNELTESGSFSLRTIKMGRYIGINVGGKLVAMGGERLRPEEFTEISGICTHPEHRGKGYAKAISGPLQI